MNHPFIKMLRYEYKSNYMMWLFNLIIGVGLLTTLYFMGNDHNSFYPIFIYPLFLLLTWVFTINSYQESTKNQSMQMYHLIPASRNTKFISKQILTFVAYPLSLALLTIFFISIIRIFVEAPDLFHKSNPISSNINSIKITSFAIVCIWLFGHSISTLFAIIFKRNKILYSILSYFGFRLVSGLLFLVVIAVNGIKETSTKLLSFTSSPSNNMILVGLMILSAFFYGISYHLFFRRQL